MIDYYESRLKRRLRAITQKPHQPFFIIGIAIAIWSLFVLLLGLNGVANVDTLTFHSVNMTLFMTTPLFLGFLFTVLYRFLLVMPFLYADYMRTFWLLVAGICLGEIGFLLSKELLLISLSLFFISQISALALFIDAYKRSTVEDKVDVFWIILLFGVGAMSTLLFVLGFYLPRATKIAIYISFYLYAAGVVFVVAQKMVPNFFAIYYGEIQPQKNRALLPLIVLALFVSALGRGFDSDILLFVASVLGFLATLKLFLQNRFIARKSVAVLWVLQLASLWFLAAFAIGVIEAALNLSKLAYLSSHMQIHAFGIGFITLMAIGFGSRVAMGHSGRKIEADRLTAYIFAAFGALAIIRIAGVFWPIFVDISAFFWLLLFVLWGAKYLPLLASE